MHLKQYILLREGGGFEIITIIWRGRVVSNLERMCENPIPYPLGYWITSICVCVHGKNYEEEATFVGGDS